MTEKKLCWLALGSNLSYGDMQPIEVLEAAIAALKDAGLDGVEVSFFYRTAPVPKSDQPDFINCVVTGCADHSALEMLEVCQSIEMSFGRDRVVRWGARTLDIDILNYGDQIYPSLEEWHAVANNVSPDTEMSKLVLPHPYMHARAFVLKPLSDVVRLWRHPVYNRTADDLYSDLPADDRAGVIPVEVK